MGYRIAVRNNIAQAGLDRLPEADFTVQRELSGCDGILVRSERLAADAIPRSCKAISRAGVGVNTLPVEELTKRGVVVFNTPGGNANSVKELVVAGLLAASRPIVPAMRWMKEIEPGVSDLHSVIESRKKDFIGTEIAGKILGVIGLGAIGVQVSNTAESLGMEVLGYDPYITVLAAWGLSSRVQRVDRLEQLFRKSDYITIHVPLTAQTEKMINADILQHSKPNLCLLNFARGELVNVHDVLAALKREQMRMLVTDFPEDEFLRNDAIIITPHLGASTVEAEESCAHMAVMQLADFLQNGNIVNSVNFPHCRMERSTPYRITIINLNIPNIVGQVTAILAKEDINIHDFTNRHKGDVAYNIIDIDKCVSSQALREIEGISGMIEVRQLTQAR